MPRLALEQLTVIDCALLDARRGLVGESWIVDVEVDGDDAAAPELGKAKRRLKRAIDEVADHRLLVPRHHAGLWMQEGDDGLAIEFRGPVDGPVHHRSPPGAVRLIDAARVDAGSVAAQVQAALVASPPAGIREVAVRLRELPADGAGFSCTHAVKRHTGHRQRVAHGHRCRLRIVVDGQRDEALEREWAARWEAAYLGTQEDVVLSTTERLRFEFAATDGSFALELPASRVALLDGDATVERIAQYVATTLAHERRGRTVEVSAHEGLRQGAIARA